jgi:hypothetical protein
MHSNSFAGSARSEQLSRIFINCEGPISNLPQENRDSASYIGESVTLLQFPASRQTGDVRRCARALMELQGPDANNFWRSEMARFADALRANGAAADDIAHQAQEFMWAVQRELQQSHLEEQRRLP